MLVGGGEFLTSPWVAFTQIGTLTLGGGVLCPLISGIRFCTVEGCSVARTVASSALAGLVSQTVVHAGRAASGSLKRLLSWGTTVLDSPTLCGDMGIWHVGLGCVFERIPVGIGARALSRDLARGEFPEDPYVRRGSCVVFCLARSVWCARARMG